MITPQQRHQSLHPLSHDHHHGLVAAVRMKQGNSPYRDMADLTEAVSHLWRTELAPHFAEEESILFNRGYTGATATLVAQALDEHRVLRSIVQRFADGGGGVEGLRMLGDLLERHIRFEERELFPAIQSEMEPEVLEEIGEAIRRERQKRE